MSKDIKMSNIKGLLIFLVVFGHLLAPHQKNFNALYLFIYSFHMPLFILVSGYFAKRASYSKVINLVLLYIIFQPLCRSYLVLINMEKIFEVKYEVPYYHLWYLASMIAWYLIAIQLNKLSLGKEGKVILILGCFLLGILSKFLTESIVNLVNNYNSEFYSYTLSYQRTLSFLPFFVLGFYLTEQTMIKLYHSLRAKWVVFVTVILGVYSYYMLTDSTNKEKILKGSYGVYEMKGDMLHTAMDIMIGYGIAIIMCYVLLNIISNKKCFLTKWGDRSLPIFIFHSFFVMYTKKQTYLKELDHGVLFVLLLVLTLGIICLLSSDLIVKRTYYLYNPSEIPKLLIRKYKNITTA